MILGKWYTTLDYLFWAYTENDKKVLLDNRLEMACESDHTLPLETQKVLALIWKAGPTKMYNDEKKPTLNLHRVKDASSSWPPVMEVPKSLGEHLTSNPNFL